MVSFAPYGLQAAAGSAQRRTCMKFKPRAAAVSVQDVHLDEPAAAERQEQGLAVRQRHHPDGAVVKLNRRQLVAQLTAFAPECDHAA